MFFSCVSPLHRTVAGIPEALLTLVYFPICRYSEHLGCIWTYVLCFERFCGERSCSPSLSVQCYQLGCMLCICCYYLPVICLCIFLFFVCIYAMNSKVKFQHDGLYPVTYMTRTRGLSKCVQSCHA